MPLLGAPSHVHQHGSAFYFGNRSSHLRIPAQPADIVNDLGSRSNSSVRHAGLVGVDGNDSVGTLFLDCSNHGQHPPQFLLGADLDFRTGTRGFSAHVNDVRSLVEQLDRMIGSLAGIEIQAAVGKRVGRHVDDAHDERALAQFQRARTEAPLKDSSHEADSN